MHAAVEVQFSRRVRLVQFETAVHVLERCAEEQSHDEVEDLRRRDLQRVVAPRLPPSADDVQALRDQVLVHLVEIARVVLKVAVHGEDVLTVAMRKPHASAKDFPRPFRNENTRIWECSREIRLRVSSVPSVEPSSTNNTSCWPLADANAPSIASTSSGMLWCSLRTGTTIENRGRALFTGSRLGTGETLPTSGACATGGLRLNSSRCSRKMQLVEAAVKPLRPSNVRHTVSVRVHGGRAQHSATRSVHRTCQPGPRNGSERLLSR